MEGGSLALTGSGVLLYSLAVNKFLNGFLGIAVLAQNFRGIFAEHRALLDLDDAGVIGADARADHLDLFPVCILHGVHVMRADSLKTEKTRFVRDVKAKACRCGAAPQRLFSRKNTLPRSKNKGCCTSLFGCA